LTHASNLRKVKLLLQAFEDAGKKIDYYALDLSKQELSRTLAQLPVFQHVRCHGLLGTYEDGREWLTSPSISAKHRCVLHMGSSIGNTPAFQYQGGRVTRGCVKLTSSTRQLLAVRGGPFLAKFH
jgi:uncharacterized SAM-dependent methyltransferase